jgi:hypothetical protein
VKLVPRKPVDPDDNIGRGMDLALVTLLFLGIGYVLDRIFDTKPAFMIGLFAFAVVGQFVKMWYVYDARMKRHEEDLAAARQAQPHAAAPATPVDAPTAAKVTPVRRAAIRQDPR